MRISEVGSTHSCAVFLSLESIRRGKHHEEQMSKIPELSFQDALNYTVYGDGGAPIIFDDLGTPLLFFGLMNQLNRLDRVRMNPHLIEVLP